MNNYFVQYNPAANCDFLFLEFPVPAGGILAPQTDGEGSENRHDAGRE